MDSDELLARQLQEEEERLMKRTMMAAQTAGQQQQQNQFLSRLQSGMETITKYEDELAQRWLYRSSCRGLEKCDGRKRTEMRGLSFRDAFIVELLKWFKHEFFSWCDKPNCASTKCCFSKEIHPEAAAGKNSENKPTKW